MAKAWLVHTGENFDLVASTQEIAINWLLEHGYARLDDEPLVESYNTKTHEWGKVVYGEGREISRLFSP